MKTFVDIESWIDGVTRWAAAQPDILALALVGSYARNAAKDTSDIDLVLMAAEPQRYLGDTAWIHQFGTVLRTQVEDYGKVTSLRAWYAGGREVEWGLAGPDWVGLPLDAGTRQVIEDGIKVLFDRQGRLEPKNFGSFEL